VNITESTNAASEWRTSVFKNLYASIIFTKSLGGIKHGKIAVLRIDFPGGFYALKIDSYGRFTSPSEFSRKNRFSAI
jgi:hypothetical protein